MPKLEHLVDMVAEQLHTENKGIAWYTSLDMQYAYGQVPLDEETAKHYFPDSWRKSHRNV